MNANQNWFQKNVALAGKYTFKNMQKMSGMEGMAWTGSLYYDGKKIGTVRDDGNGGMLWIDVVPEAKARLKSDSVAYFVETNPGVQLEEEMFKFVSAEEHFLPFLGDWVETLSKLKSACKTKVLVIDERCVKEGQYLAHKSGSIAHLAAIKAKNPTHFYINDQF